jgi:hypothetical protein
MSKEGTVVAVCMSPEHGYPTHPQTSIAVGLLGIDGDAHSGPLRESFRNPGTLKNNDRPISIVADEVRVWVNSSLNLTMEHGDFNEQMVVSGLGDLGDIPIGAHLIFSSGLELEVVDRAYPCAKLEAHNGKGLIKALAEKRDGEVYSRRGILCKVIEIGELEPGATVRVENRELTA